MRDLTQEELHVLRHSLGTGEHGRKPSYRNHFVTGEGSKDHPTCMQLVELGLMQRCTGSAISGGADIFTVTAEGRVAARAARAAPLTAGQRRYRAFLDADSGMTFGKWLTSRGPAHA
ncbi:hypothetical protein CFBP498_26240 [Xanthomonas hortorum pv. vitians]|uniref:Uncharacterized protein n=1 Tax=Xanthomonas hortorum pv. vitians TaxID=83224 RepID=A0A6V7DR04_9XANT|nr:hypothetical protein [Xanthomonas hortorum]MCE4302380.1 hypothetical protein [Xanthomonas hortorum pv. vitians]MDT7826211.1 hypothetical protein [Xanthomonas hortorum pv. vitians]MDV7248626.1 hypothetical protein [Xanthomonas hortorum pv. vitians]NMI32478.1 hypothetical protein [Xanthomonas hortorum pv. vitians]CAD0338868.1 hypothetical protein CFBP498_26240 [Xanthomonas hortorum pv. vitians]